MCGISGYLLRDGERAETRELERMAGSMRARGPDHRAAWASGNLGFAHARLRVIDLSEAADQPMHSADSRFSLVFNGEIYNFRELRRELEGLGRAFRTSSDTEVALQAFEQWGLGSFARLNGMFAIGLWDSRERALHLARDRFGIKPMFVARGEGGRVAFASELKPLLELGWVGRRVSRQALFHYLKFSHVPSPSSMLEGVEQLEPGTARTFRAGHPGEAPRVTRFHDPLELSRPAREGLSEAEALDELDRRLTETVGRQMVSDVPLGCFLSGGIDSSLLTLTAARLSAEPLHTFTVGYAEASYDESPFALRIARDVGSRHHELILEPRHFFDLIPELPGYFDQPFADPTLLPSLLLCREARRHVTVALSGDGGDELFFGYSYQKMLLRLERAVRVPSSARALGLEPLRAAASLVPGRKAHGAVKLLEILQARDEAELLQYFIGTVGPMRLDRLARLMAEPPALDPPLYATWLPQVAHLPWAARIEQTFIRTFLVDTVLTKTDRSGMAYGLEARVPWLDDSIAEFSATLPFDLKYRGGQGKYLLRKLLERKLRDMPSGAGLAWRGKQGFSIPIGEWLRGGLRYLLDEHLSPERVRAGGDFDPGAVSALVRSHLSGRANQGHLLWSLVSFQLWKQRYLGSGSGVS